MKRVGSHKVVVLSTLLFAGLGLQGITLVEDGESDYVIAVEPSASAAEARAASELNQYLASIGGTRLPVVPRDRVDGRKAVYIGQSAQIAELLGGIDFQQLGDDEIIIRVVDGDLILSGGSPRGTLYAVYTFLEDQLGVRFWTHDSELVPERDVVKVADDLNVRYKPEIYSRETFYKPYLDYPEFAAKHKVNGHWEVIPEEYGTHLEILGWCHTFHQLVPAADFFESHPEYFAMRDGVRKADAQLCLTHPGAYQAVLEAAREWLSKNPEARVIDISQNDTPEYCMCPECGKRAAELGSQTDLLLDFMNRIAADLEKEYPKINVMTLAYQHTRYAPKKVVPRHNVCVRLCASGVNGGYPANDDANAAFRADVESWGKLAPQLALWNYQTNFLFYFLPYPNLSFIASDIRFFRENHAVAFFQQGDVGSGMAGDLVPLRSYLTSKLLWNPNLDQAALQKEFLDGYYGAAGRGVQAYIDYVNDCYRKHPVPLTGAMGDCDGYLDNQELMQARAILDDAAQTVVEDVTLSERVRQAQIALDLCIVNRFRLGRGDAFTKDFPEMTPMAVRGLLENALADMVDSDWCTAWEMAPVTLFYADFMKKMAFPFYTADEVAAAVEKRNDWISLPVQSCMDPTTFVRHNGVTVIEDTAMWETTVPVEGRYQLFVRLCSVPGDAKNNSSANCRIEQNGSVTGRTLFRAATNGETPIFQECGIMSFKPEEPIVISVAGVGGAKLFIQDVVLVPVSDQE